jgi:hypothetical protein
VHYIHRKKWRYGLPVPGILVKQTIFRLKHTGTTLWHAFLLINSFDKKKQWRRFGMPSRPSGLGFFLFLLFAWWPPLVQKFLTRKSSGGHQARKRKKGRKNWPPLVQT